MKRLSYEADWRPYAFAEDDAGFATEEELAEQYCLLRLDKQTALQAGGMPIWSNGQEIIANIDDNC